MRKTFLIHHISGFKGWETCFHFAMDKSDTFQIIFQVDGDASDEDGLNAGKQKFLGMPSITIAPYKGMENSIEVTGELNTASQELFQSYMNPSFEGWNQKLWSFQFLQGNDVVLRLEDFSVALLFLDESEVADLLALGISVDGTDFQEIDNFPAG